MITRMQINGLSLITEHDGPNTHMWVSDDVLAEHFPAEYNTSMTQEQFFTLAKKHIQMNEPMVENTTNASIGEVEEN
jgi:hypothetical protein